MPAALWWGRSDPDYSRNRLLLKLFAELGWEIDFFRPAASWAGRVESFLRRPRHPDVVWVPCFRQRDIASAAAWARRRKVPLVVDPLISAYEKEVFEKHKWLPESKRAERKRRQESNLFAAADVVVADTPAHAAFFREKLDVRPEKICVLYVGAETDLFSATAPQPLRPPFEVLFFGSFLKLQGPDVIVQAAAAARDLPARWVLLGDGDLKAGIERQAKGMPNIAFEPWIRFNALPERIGRADILLGIFGTTLKADLVIPNKMFQAMAAVRPVITRTAAAYPLALRESDVIGWVPPGDPPALAGILRKWLEQPVALSERGRQTRRLFDAHFNAGVLRQQLTAILEKAGSADSY